MKAFPDDHPVWKYWRGESLSNEQLKVAEAALRQQAQQVHAGVMAEGFDKAKKLKGAEGKLASKVYDRLRQTPGESLILRSEELGVSDKYLQIVADSLPTGQVSDEILEKVIDLLRLRDPI